MKNKDWENKLIKKKNIKISNKINNYGMVVKKVSI